ncbi:MAG: ABC transporter permease subunit [Lachnospiraceae bacterium]|nr:ABC transporter permease subunit [Lachnospiraceae bacterium]
MSILTEMKLLYTNVTLQALLKALFLSFELAGGILLASLVTGTIFALLKTYAGKFFGRFITIYVEIFRNTPILLWVCVCFIALPFGNRFVRAASGLFFVSTASVCEIVRGGLNSIERGQIEAGRSQGLSGFQIVYAIVLPQCIKRVLPNFINQTISVFKDTSFMGQVAIPEFLYCSRQLLGTADKYTGHGIEAKDAFIIFGVAAAVYFFINLFLSSLLRRLDAKKI